MNSSYQIKMRYEGFTKGLIINSRGAARRGAVRWVEIFGNFYKIVCMVVLSFFFLLFFFKSQSLNEVSQFFFFQKPELEGSFRNFGNYILLQNQLVSCSKIAVACKFF